MSTSGAADLPNVLLVDDRPENLLALEAVLAPLPCRLVSVTSGQEALRRLLHDEFALILLDVQMPELDGFETADYIKRRRKTRAVPIIFVTAISKERHHVFRGYETGAVDYVFKPYDPELLRAKVQVFLDLHDAGRQVQRSEELLRATFDSAPIGMARLDGEGAFQQVNRALCQILGVREGVLLGRALDQLTHPDDVEVDAEDRRRLLANKLPSYDVEKRLLGAGGEEVDAQLSFSTAHDDEGRLRALLVQVQDIRERRRAQRAWEQLVREQAARAEAEAAAERQAAIRSITDAALSPLGLGDLLKELLERISAVVGVDGAAIVLHEGDGAGHVVVHAAGEAAAYVSEHGTGIDGGLAARVMAERRPVVIEDAHADSSLRDHPLGAAVASLVGVPLMVGDRPIGALEVGTLFGRGFADDDLDLLQLTADRAALAIERVRLFERQQKIAEELQRSLLPQSIPVVPGLAMAARYLPGGAGTRVGGDWYDTIALPGGRVALVIGDVAGRGVAAAAMMGQLRSALRAYILDGATPGQALERLNRFLLSLGWDSMATAVVLLLEAATGRLTYANAGHPPPMVLDEEGVTRTLVEPLSVPLGALDVVGYDEGAVRLEPGATLVLYTDGLVEQRDELIDRGIERLQAALVSGPAVEPEPLCDRILSGTAARDSSDDVTVLVVQSMAFLGERLEIELLGEPAALASFRQTLRRWLAESGAQQDEVHDVVMAVNEACQNAIEHAYGLTPEPFDVVLDVEEGEIVVTVRDRGGWRETRSEDRGRGLPLMRALMDAVEIEQRPSGSTVTLRRALRTEAAAGV